jgi:peptidoglycan/LPS O-acetylase OafA/YrhL
MQINTKNRLANLDILRGLAALAVCFYHFRRDMLGGMYNTIAAYGFYGVDIFFVISGFVIPLALWKSKFTYRKTISFWIARFVRLYPAYFFASIIGLGLWYASTLVPGFRGSPPPLVTINQVLANLGLFCDLAAEKWFLGVAWTLAIEAQYYVLISLMFPLITSQKYSIKIFSLFFWFCVPLILTPSYFVFKWTALFGMGLIIMLYQQRLLNLKFLLLFLFASFAMQWFIRSEISAALGIATALFILLVPPLHLPRLIWVGGISYSLYLLHQPFGGRVMNFLERYPNSTIASFASVPLALACSLLVSYLFFKLVEWPSHKLSRVLRDKLQ